MSSCLLSIYRTISPRKHFDIRYNNIKYYAKIRANVRRFIIDQSYRFFRIYQGNEDHPVGRVEDVDETGNLLIIRGSIDSKEYSVPKNTVINVDKSSDKIVLYMTRDDFIKYAKV